MNPMIPFATDQQTCLQFENATRQTMSSRLIAEATGKRHVDVKRDIKNMQEKLEIDVSRFAHIYLDSMNRQQTEYELPFHETMVLITGYDMQLRSNVLRRWEKYEKEASKPSQLTAGHTYHLDAISQLAPVYNAMLSLVETIAPRGEINPMAAAATAKLTGYNLADLFDLAADQHQPPVESAIQQSALEERAPENKVLTRKHLRQKSRYELDDYLSIRELSELTGIQEKSVRKVLINHRIVERIYRSPQPHDPKSVRFLLTDKGWDFGLMYDPTDVTFYTTSANRKRIINSNAQPVFGYEILKFFQ